MEKEEEADRKRWKVNNKEWTEMDFASKTRELKTGPDGEKLLHVKSGTRMT